MQSYWQKGSDTALTNCGKLTILLALLFSLALFANALPINSTEPVPQVKPRPVIINQIEPSRGTERTMRMTATAYTWTGNRTASGTWPREHRTIAADISILPFGTRVRLTCPTWPEVDGIYTVEDRGGLVHGRKVDIYMGDYKTCLLFGVREVYLTVIDEQEG